MRTKKTTPYLYMLPGCAMVLVFVYIPVIANCVYSFFRLSSYSAGMKFVGLDNYIRFFHNESLGIMLRNNLLYCVISLIVQVGFGTVIALLLESKLASSRFRNAFRNIYYIPALISLTAVGLMFTFIYEPNLGLLNSAFKALGLTSMTQSWLGDSKIAIYCIIAMSQWQYTGYITLLMVVAFQNVSPDYIEAASIDGAGPVQKNSYWYVLLLLLLVHLNCLQRFILQPLVDLETVRRCLVCSCIRMRSCMMIWVWQL